MELLCSLLRDAIISNNIDLALEYAKELDLAKYNVWNLLHLIAAKDIGRIHANITSYITKEQAHYTFHENINVKRMILLNMVVYLSKLPKSEYCASILKDYDTIVKNIVDNPNLDEWQTMIGFYASLRDHKPINALKFGLILFRLIENGWAQYKYLFTILEYVEVMDSEMEALFLRYSVDTENQLIYFINMILHRTKFYNNSINYDHSYLLNVEDVKKIYGC